MDFHWITGIEDTFIPHASPGKRRLDEYELMQHYQFWHEDLDLMAWLGVDMARYGIPWYKVEPSPGRFDWAWTDRVMARFAELGISPILDLMHYGTPLWLDNLFLNNEYPSRVAAYAGEFARRYPDVLWYTPLNEPYINALFCGETAYWPPYLSGDHGFVSIWRQLVRGMVLTEQSVRAETPRARFCQVDASTLFLPQDPESQERAAFLNERLFLTYDVLLGRVEGQADYLLRHGMTEAELFWHREHPATFDAMGVNFYPELSVHELSSEGSRSVRVGVDLYKQVVRSYWERYKIPIFHTESSTNAPVEVRLEWLESSLSAVRELRAEGVALEGYCWWPLYDLIDWEYRHGAEPVERYLARMGLWSLEMGFDGLFRRVKTPVADRFREHVATFDVGPLVPHQERC